MGWRMSLLSVCVCVMVLSCKNLAKTKNFVSKNRARPVIGIRTILRLPNVERHLHVVIVSDPGRSGDTRVEQRETLLWNSPYQ